MAKKPRFVETSVLQTDAAFEHISKSYDNTYRLHPLVEFESVDTILNVDSLHLTKFAPILLKEWLRYLSVGGTMRLISPSNKLFNKHTLLTIFKQFLAPYSNIEKLEFVNGKIHCTIKKNASMLIDGDSVDKWTFGMLTIGKRNDWVKQYIESIRSLNIPQYEIIIIGTWNDFRVSGDDIKYIHYTQKDEKAWITRKKNIVYQQAKYENVFILHDRFFFDSDWFKGMRTYGNSFDALYFPIIDKTNHTYVHWSKWGSWIQPIGYADIRDWDFDYFAGGTFMAIKRSFALKVPLDETRFWGEVEDAEHGLRFTLCGFLTSANPHSHIHTTVTYLNDAPVYTFSPISTGRPVEYRSAKWLVIQPIVDILTRVFDKPFLRFRRSISLLLKKFITKMSAPQPGGIRH